MFDPVVRKGLDNLVARCAVHRAGNVSSFTGSTSVLSGAHGDVMSRPVD